MGLLGLTQVRTGKRKHLELIPVMVMSIKDKNKNSKGKAA